MVKDLSVKIIFYEAATILEIPFLDGAFSGNYCTGKAFFFFLSNNIDISVLRTDFS